jgi:hypothetical protein
MIKTTTMTPTKKPKNDKYDIEVLHVSCGWCSSSQTCYSVS